MLLAKNFTFWTLKALIQKGFFKIWESLRRSSVSGLKTGCSRSYVCFETSIFFRCSPLYHPLSVSSLQRRSFRAFSFSQKHLFFFFLYTRTPAKQKTVYNGADEWSKPFFGSSFLSLFFYSPFLFAFTCLFGRFL